MLELYFNRLLILLEEVEVSYFTLEELETLHNETSASYNETLEGILDSRNEIQNILEDLINFNLLESFYWYIEEKLNNKKEPLFLGQPNLELFRIRNMLESMIGDSNFDYIGALKYDKTRLSLKVIAELLKNPEYESIRDYLLKYKYALIYMNPTCEIDLLDGNLDNHIELYTNQLRNVFLPSYHYLDEAVLILPTNDSMAFLESNPFDFKNNPEEYARVVIAIIIILSHLNLCNQRTVFKCESELDYLMNGEGTSRELKETIAEIAEILGKIQETIKWAK